MRTIVVSDEEVAQERNRLIANGICPECIGEKRLPSRVSAAGTEYRDCRVCNGTGAVLA